MCSVCKPIGKYFSAYYGGSAIIYGIYKLHVQQFYVVNYRDIKVYVKRTYVRDYLERVTCLVMYGQV